MPNAGEDNGAPGTPSTITTTTSPKPTPTVTPAAPKVASRSTSRKAKKPTKTTAASGQLTFAQLESLAMAAGATPTEAVTLAAIAMGESGGRVMAHNGNTSTGDNSYGLWQINMLGQMGTNRQRSWGLSSNNDLFDPLTNAKAAVALLRARGGYGDWSVYNHGTYQRFLPGAQAATAEARTIDATSITAESSGATAGLGTPQPQSVADFLNDPNIVGQYGYLAAYMKDPEVGPILAKAAKEGWNAGELLSALQKTKWWAKTSATSRQMQELQREDPASYKEQITNQTAQINALATSMGITLDPKRAGQLATTSLWSGWSSLQLQEAVGAEFHYKAGSAYTGTAGADVQKFKALASNYLVPLSDQTLGSWTQQALQGKINPDDFTGYLAEQAKTLFPWMSKAIDGGVTPNQYLDPYRQAAAQTLEVDPNSINFTDPKWLGLVQTTDPKTGQRGETGLANAMVAMRTDPRFGYDKTQGARDQAAAFAASIAQTFGYQASGGLAGVANPTG